MNNMTDITRLSPSRRTEIVAEAFGNDPERAAVALIGLQSISQKPAEVRRRARTECVVVVPTTVAGLNGEVISVDLYLTDNMVGASMERTVGTLREARIFPCGRDADKALQWKQDAADRNAAECREPTKPVGRVAEYASLQLPFDALTAANASINVRRTSNGGLGL